MTADATVQPAKRQPLINMVGASIFQYIANFFFIIMSLFIPHITNFPRMYSVIS